MPIGHQNLEWLNHNGQRRYPLADDAEAVDDSGSFRLPDEFLVELDLPIHAGLNVGPAGFYLRYVAAYAGGYGLTVAYQPADGDPVNVASALIPRQGFVRNSVFVLGGVNDFADTVGKVVVGRLDEIDRQPPGQWEFTLAGARLDPDAVRPIVRGVSSVVCVNGDQRSVPLYGDVELVAGANMQLVPILLPGQDPVIRINAISGEGTVNDCVCEGDAALSTPIKMINGAAPTTAGDLTLVGNDCLQIEAITNGVRVSVPEGCGKPCCGCPELERLTQDLERFAAQAGSVEGFVDRLQSAVDTMSMTVLGSRLGDRNCVQCE